MKTEEAPRGNGEKTLPLLLTSRQVSELVGVAPRTLWRYARSGRMPPPRKIGALVRFSRTEIEEWIADGCPAVDDRATRRRAAG
ncbi:MAG TPA: helix-turn-helix domain-containing protein [Phycisphaerae bacterium]|nr:helix-turn-helix domain-containing protein [Phycisphaerae bacterium]